MLNEIKEYLDRKDIDYSEFKDGTYDAINVYDTYGFSYFDFYITNFDEALILVNENIATKFNSAKDVIKKIDEIVLLEVKRASANEKIKEFSYEKGCMFALLNSNKKDRILSKETIESLQIDYDKLCEEIKGLRSELDKLLKEEIEC